MHICIIFIAYMGRVACALLLMLVIINGYSQASVFEGTIGDSAIVFQFSDAYGASFFYKGTLHNNELLGYSNEDSAYLELKHPYSDRLLAVLNITRQHDESWKGTYTDNNTAAVSPVILKPLDFKNIDRRYDRIEYVSHYFAESYYYYRLSMLRFIDDSTSRIGKYKLQWKTEPLSGISFFTIISGYDSAAINIGIYTHIIPEIESALDCGLPEGYSFYTAVSSPVFINQHYVSYTITTNYDCNEISPRYDYKGVVLNNHGKDAYIDDIIWLGTWPKDSAALEEDYEVRVYYDNKVLAPTLLSLMQKFHANEMRIDSTDKENGSCGYNDVENWSEVNWFLQKDGLWICPKYSGNTACEMPDWTVIPYSYLKKYMQPEVYKRLKSK